MFPPSCVCVSVISILCVFVSCFHLTLILSSLLLRYVSPPFSLRRLFSISPHLWLLPSSLSSVHTSLHLSSDLYKSLQSGSQAALPPHLQLAFSGNLHSSSSSSSSICTCQSTRCPLLSRCVVCFVYFCLLQYIWRWACLCSSSIVEACCIAAELI